MEKINLNSIKRTYINNLKTMPADNNFSAKNNKTDADSEKRKIITALCALGVIAAAGAAIYKNKISLNPKVSDNSQGIPPKVSVNTPVDADIKPPVQTPPAKTTPAKTTIILPENEPEILPVTGTEKISNPQVADIAPIDTESQGALEPVATLLPSEPPFSPMTPISKMPPRIEPENSYLSVPLATITPSVVLGVKPNVINSPSKAPLATIPNPPAIMPPKKNTASNHAEILALPPASGIKSLNPAPFIPSVPVFEVKHPEITPSLPAISPKQTCILSDDKVTVQTISAAKEGPAKILALPPHIDETHQAPKSEKISSAPIIKAQKIVSKTDDAVSGGIVKEHYEGMFSIIQKKNQFDRDNLINWIELEYFNLKLIGADLSTSLLAQLGETEKCADLFGETLVWRKAADAFPDKKSYAKAVLDYLELLIEDERSYLRSQKPLNEAHRFYRGFGSVVFDGDITKSLFENMRSWKKGKIVIPQFNPMYAISDMKTCLGFSAKDKNGVSRILQIDAPKGSHIPFVNSGETFFPSKSKFKFLGCEKENGVEIIKLEYIPFEKKRFGFLPF